jgi:hypothetical protein
MKSWIHLGPGKSGSTWLYKIAFANPDLFIVPRIKETQCFHYSSNNFPSFFSGSLDNTKIYCDFSNTYIFNPLAVQHLLDYCNRESHTEVLLTALLRCPLERAVSHYLYLKASGLVPPKISFEAHIAADPSILWRSRYEIHLSFLISQGLPVKLFLLESQSSSEPEIIQKVISLLLPKDTPVTYNAPDKKARFASMESRNYFASKLAKTIAESLRSSGNLTLLSALKENTAVRRVFMKPQNSKITLEPQTFKQLQSFFRPTYEFMTLHGLPISSTWLNSIPLP